MTGDEKKVEGLLEEYLERRIDRRKFFQGAAALGLTVSGAASLLAACGGDDEAEKAAPAGKPVKGGTLIEGYDRDFTAMDSVRTGWADPAFVSLYEFSVARDAKGEYVPAFVESWTVSDDLLTWTFTIPPGRKFHSGAPVTADMIASNFNAFRDPKEGQNAIFWPTVEDVKAVDDTTVVVTMKAPFTAFPETLATEFAMVENLDTRKKLGQDYGAQGADGTGPFTLTSFKPGTEVVVTRWEGYPGTKLPYIKNKGPAHLKAVKWVPILEPGNRANEIETGNVHVVKNPAGQDVDRLRSNGDLVTISFPALANYFLGPNSEKKEKGLDDIRVRQAISHAIDRQALVDSLFFGEAVATYGPIAPNFKWYEKGVEQFNQFDPERSKALLDEAGWKPGPGGTRQKGGQKLSFTNVNNAGQPTTRKIDEAIVDMLREVGIEMKLEIPDAANFFPRVLDTKKVPDSWSFEWLWSSPVDLLIFFQAFPRKSWNGDLPEIATAVKKWQTAPDIETLEEAARDFQLAWAEKLPEIPILTTNNIWVHHKRLKGFQPLETMLYPFYNDVFLES